MSPIDTKIYVLRKRKFDRCAEPRHKFHPSLFLPSPTWHIDPPLGFSLARMRGLQEVDTAAQSDT